MLLTDMLSFYIFMLFRFLYSSHPFCLRSFLFMQRLALRMSVTPGTSVLPAIDEGCHHDDSTHQQQSHHQPEQSCVGLNRHSDGGRQMQAVERDMEALICQQVAPLKDMIGLVIDGQQAR